MIRTLSKFVLAVLFAAFVAVAAVALAYVPQAHAEDQPTGSTVTVQANEPDGVVGVVEGTSGLEPGSLGQDYSQSITLKNTAGSNGGSISFATRATSPYIYIESITITYEGKNYVVGSYKSDDHDAVFYDWPTDSSAVGLQLKNFVSTNNNTEANLGVSFENEVNFVLSGIKGDVVINVQCEWTEQYQMRFHLNYDAGDTADLDPHYRHPGEQFGAAPDDPVREGYTFLGWATSPDGQPEAWNPEEYMGTKNLDFYAVWQKSDSPTSPEDEGEQPLPPSKVDDDPDEDADNAPGKDADDAAGNELSDKAAVLAATGDGMMAVAVAAGVVVVVSALVAGYALVRSRRHTGR